MSEGIKMPWKGIVLNHKEEKKKKKEILLFVTARMDLEAIRLSEIKTEKDKQCGISLNMWNL